MTFQTNLWIFYFKLSKAFFVVYLKFGWDVFGLTVGFTFVFFPADKADIFWFEILGEIFGKFFVSFGVETIKNPLFMKFEEPVLKCFFPEGLGAFWLNGLTYFAELFKLGLISIFFG